MPTHPGEFVMNLAANGFDCEVRLIEVVNAYVGHINRDGWPWGKITADTLEELQTKFEEWEAWR